MSAVVADTHVAVWTLIAPDRLSAEALSALKGAVEAGDPIHVASVSSQKWSIDSELVEAFHVVLLTANASPFTVFMGILD